MSTPRFTAASEDTVSLLVFWPCTVAKITRRQLTRSTVVFILPATISLVVAVSCMKADVRSALLYLKNCATNSAHAW